LLGHQIGHERLLAIRRSGRANVAAVASEQVRRTGIGSRDVFRAWRSLAVQLEDPTLSVSGIRVRLEGRAGAAALWEKLCAEAVSESGLVSRDEVWLYGAELVRALRSIVIPECLGVDEKRALVTALCERVKSEATALRPPAEAQPWFRRVKRFYGI
jgi:hypothetical protein